MKDTSEEEVRIYTGPRLIAQGLISRLNEIGISPIVKDDHESGITAGFAIGVPGQVRLFLRKVEAEKAKEIIALYLQEIGE